TCLSFLKNLFFCHRSKKLCGSSLAYKKCVCLNNFKAFFAFFYAAFTGLFDLFFFLDKKEPKNQERNMLSTLFV
ncbi:MAG: hypothetical protein CMD31_07445, partial [Flavobacteriales bacterium]|nr:hypothetical protein [Flavobacteriales bacterium]